ncbi:breast cancer type 1 susceptibility protein homolog isoform X2 [Acipenser ruthenus]|nr:breast cancer type 1 susceptibility protein homolog isoform X2 [Acipenser ruthenus]
MAIPMCKTDDVKQVLSMIHKNLQCPICLDLMKEPVSTKCDHHFCRLCMLNLLSRKKGGLAECPLCKSDVTKRSLQDSPRFKLLVEGLLRTIHGFEQDTGTEFYTGSVLSKKAPEQSSCGELWKSDGTIQSTGHRNRTKKKTASNGMRENNVEGQLTIEDSDVVVRKVSQRNKRLKLESAVPLCIEINSSEEELFKKKDINGAEESGFNQAQANGKKTNVEAKSWERGCDGTNDIPSNRQIELEMVSSTAAEDGFAELMGLEEDSCLTNSGTRQASLSEEMAEVRKYRSAVDVIQQPTAAEQKTDYDPNISSAKTNDAYFIAASKEENGTLGKRKKAESQKHYLDKNETVTNGKSALNQTEDKEISLQDGESKHEFDFAMVTASAKRLRKRISRSIEKVTEWLSTIDETALVSGIQDNKDEKPVDLDCHDNAEKCPSDGESISDETEIIAQQALENLAKNDRRSQVDKVFGRTYRRDKKLSAQVRKSFSSDNYDFSSTSPKENQGLQEDQKASMRKRSSELTLVDLIKKPRCEDKSPNKTQEKESCCVNQTENHNIISDAVTGDDSGGRSSNDQQLRKIVRAEKTDIEHSLNDLRNDMQHNFQENGEKYVRKSNKRKSHKRSSTTRKNSTKTARPLALVSCQLIQNLDQGVENGGPSNLTDIQIDSYPSSENQAVAGTRVTRRSRRLQLAVEVIRDKKRCRKPSANKSENDVCVEKVSDSVNVEEDCFESEKDLQRLEATSPRLQDSEDNPALEAAVIASNNQDTGEPNMSEIRLVNEKSEVCNENQVVEESSILSMVPNTESDPSFLQNSKKNKPFLQPSAIQMPPACDQPTEAEEHFHNKFLTETEDSELDTELLMKTFKNTKRKSFNLLPSPVTKEDDISFQNEGLENKLHDSDKLNFIANSVCSKGAAIKPDTPGEPKPFSFEDSGIIPPTDPDSAGNAALPPFLKCRETSSTVCSDEENVDQNACYDSLHRDQSSKALKGKETALNEEILPRKGCSMRRKKKSSRSPSPRPNSNSLPISALLFPALSESQNHQEINLRNTNRILEVNNTKKTAEVCSSNEKAEEQVTEHTVVEPSLQTQKNIPAAVRKESEESSMTPDGLLFHYIVGDDGRVGGVDPSLKAGKSQESLNEHSQTLYKKRRRLQRLESSESESSNEEVLPSFMEFLFGNKPDPQSNHETLPVLPPKTSPMQNLPQPYGSMDKQGGAADSNAEERIVADLSGQLASPSSQESVDLFATQSDVSEHSLKQQKGRSPKAVSQNSHRLSGENLSGCSNEKREDTEEQLEVAHGFEHDASHNGESPALSSQSEILTTQQKDTMQTNLNHLEREMAVLQAVLEQQGTQESEESPCQGKGQSGEKDDLDSHQTTSCSQGEDQNTACARSPTPPSTPSDSQLRLKRTPVQVKAAINLLSKLNAANLSQEAKADTTGDGKRNWEEMEKKTGDDTSGQFNQKELEDQPNTPQIIENKVDGLSGRKGAIENSSPPATCSTLSAGGMPAPISAVSRSRLTPGIEDPKGPVDGNRKQSPLKVPTPLESTANTGGAKRPVLRRKMSLVASGLNKSELMLVQEFAKKIQVTLSSQVTPGTTHIIMKTEQYHARTALNSIALPRPPYTTSSLSDKFRNECVWWEDSELVCERTLKYFLGIAGRKWVVGYQWIVECFKQRQVLDEAEFEVRGDIINGRNHKGPRRARTTMDGKLLLNDYEICCYGTFTDMSKGQLEWMVELCGATVIKEPCLFTYSPDRSPVVIVQPDSGGKEIDYKALQRQYNASVVTREWILDSVACYSCHSLDSYLAEPLH